MKHNSETTFISEQDVLREGETIYLENGTRIKAIVPSKFISFSLKNNDELIKIETTIGETYEYQSNAEQHIYELKQKIINDFYERGFQVNVDDVNNFVSNNVSVPEKETITFEQGEYIVENVHSKEMRTHSPFEDDDYCIYEITCKKLKPNGKYNPDAKSVILKQLYKDDYIEPIGKMVKYFY